MHGVKRDMCGTYRSIEENGGLYGVANISANVAAISTYSAGALVALHLYAAGWDNWYHVGQLVPRISRLNGVAKLLYFCCLTQIKETEDASRIER